MSEGLEPVLQRIKRAKEKRVDLDRAVVAFADTKPYIVGIDEDLDTGNTVFYLRNVEDVPACVSNLLGDFVHLARTALDHLAYQLLLIENPSPAEEEVSRIEFPFYDPAKKSESNAFRPIKSLRPEFIEAIRRTKAYKGGNAPLWTLHRLDIIDKHRRIVSTSCVHNRMHTGEAVRHLLARSGHVDMAGRINRRFSERTPRTGAIAKVGDILLVRQSVDREVREKLKFTFDVAINEPGVVEGESLLGTVESLCDVVENLVSDFAPFFG
jgi:hypothetical protein